MANNKPATKFCKHCKTVIPYGAKVCPQCRRKQGGALKWIIIAFFAFCVIGAIGGGNNSEPGGTRQVNSENNEVTHTNVSSSEEYSSEPDSEESVPEITLDEIKQQAGDLVYKDVMRNPENYTGQYFHVRVKILTVETGSLFSGYDKAYKSYTNDEYDLWYGDMIYLLDSRDTESEEYVKILEDDIVDIYGRFDGLVETKNNLNGTKGEEMSLRILYAEIISE